VVTDFVPGDNISLRRTIARDGGGVPDEVLPDGATIVKAWFTIKEKVSDADGDALIQKEITTLASAGIGEIENDGSGDTDPVLRFDLVPANTLVIGVLPKRYDVQVLTSTGEVYTPEVGKIYASTQQVTIASS
jgi:hypothetical protein